LDTLSETVIRAALAEIIKQGIFQSDALLEYVLSDSFRPFSRREDLLKAVVWAADLKRVCIEYDPEESADGARIILRAGHDISDRLEEKFSFGIPHGYAVAVGIVKQLEEQNDRRAAVARVAFARFGIPTSESELLAAVRKI
jgi:3-dehydroquinate synthetase